MLLAAGLTVLLLLTVSCGAAGSPQATQSSAQPIKVVAAENFYGDIAQQIGGGQVLVVSLLKDPNIDPHEYDPNVDDAKALANAHLVIKNGLGYDAFVDKLLAASPRANRVVIDVGQLTGHKEGDNPHIWYDPSTMRGVADRLTTAFGQLDAAHADIFTANLQAFLMSEQAVDDEVAAIRSAHRGTRALATEPVFNYMADALGLDMVDPEGPFQKAVESGNDPPASAVVGYRGALASRAVKVLIVNSQTLTPITTQMRDLARQNGIPVAAVSETLPEGKSYQEWMLEELRNLRQALEK